MARRVTPSQLRSQIQRAQQQHRQAIGKYNAAVRKTNQAINNYNAAARRHNANRERLRRELTRLSANTRTTRHVTFRTSVMTVQESFRRVEAVAATDRWVGGSDLFDLIEGEAANSAEIWNLLADEPSSERAANHAGDPNQMVMSCPPGLSLPRRPRIVRGEVDFALTQRLDRDERT